MFFYYWLNLFFLFKLNFIKSNIKISLKLELNGKFNPNIFGKIKSFLNKIRQNISQILAKTKHGFMFKKATALMV